MTPFRGVDSPLTSVALPAALALIMFGLGLSLTVDDFRRIGREPKPVGVALVHPGRAPARCCASVWSSRSTWTPILAVGMMLLAASPGGTTANLFSHLFHGDVALNITLTALNSVIAVVTLPIVVNAAVSDFDPPGADEHRASQLGQDAAGVRDRAGAGRHRHGRTAQQARLRGRAPTSPCG